MSASVPSPAGLPLIMSHAPCQLVIGVRIAPGCTEFTRMPCRAYSSASVFMMPTTPNFAAQ